MPKSSEQSIRASGFIKERLRSIWTKKLMGRLWIRFLLPYLLFLVLTLTAGWIAYRETIDVLEREVLERNDKALYQAQTLLETRFAEVESIVQQVADHPKVKGFQLVSDPFVGTNTYKVMATRSALDDYSVSNRFLMDYFVIFQNSSLVISPHRVESVDSFYGDVLRYRDWDIRQWKQEMLKTFHLKDFIGMRTVRYRQTEESMVTYVRSLGYPGYYQGAVVALIPHTEIEKILQSIDVQQGGTVRIINRQGEIIGSIGSGNENSINRMIARSVSTSNSHYRTDMDGQDMLVSQIASAKTGWTYIAAQPAADILESVHAIKRTTFTLVGISLAVIVLLALWLSHRHSRPLERLYSYVHAYAKPGMTLRGKRSDIFAYLRDAFAELLETTKTLDQKLTERQEYARMAVFDKWLRGGYATEQQLHASLEHAGLERNASRYAVALLQLGWHGDDWSASVLHEMELKRLVVMDEAFGMASVPCDVHDIEQDQVALLFYDTHAGGQTAPEDEAARFKHEIEHTLHELCKRLKQSHVTPICTVGGMVARRLDVPRSLEQAQQLQSVFERDAEAAWTWWDERESGCEDMYAYNPDVELRLIHAVRGGNEEELIEALHAIRTENWERRHLSRMMQQWLLMDVYATAMKLSQTVDAPMLADNMLFQQKLMKKGAELHKLFHLIEQEFAHLCRLVHERKRSRNETLFEDMMTYIHANYADSSLSLTAVADELHVSEAYVSAFFKEQRGMNFSDYVEELRLEAAKAMIKQGLPVTAIAERVGYNSLNSFSRAFKRTQGMSASEYRKTLSS
ncbi:AraC family transcriptional regulator [Paenibacillus apiarius]|uniref:AraC family transcriptional regulator n=1 Tax=Paenibacillus apiarius TaxID=46240 RepID=UPI003B3BD398